eukprot:9449689-Pyramimonas_sp.AAC.1
MRGRVEGRRSMLMLWKGLQDGTRVLRWGRGADCDDEYDGDDADGDDSDGDDGDARRRRNTASAPTAVRMREGGCLSLIHI